MELLLDRIDRAERLLGNLKRQTAPTIPQYDLQGGVTLHGLRLNTQGNGGVVSHTYADDGPGGLVDSFYIEFDVAFDSSLLADIRSSGPTDQLILELFANDYRFVHIPQVSTAQFYLDIDGSGNTGWIMYIADQFGPDFRQSDVISDSIVGNTWYHQKIHINPTVSPVVLTWEANGNSVTGLNLSDTTMTDIGIVNIQENGSATLGVNQYQWYRNFKMGTTLGDNDVINQPFDTPPIDAFWDFVFDASIV